MRGLDNPNKIFIESAEYYLWKHNEMSWIIDEKSQWEGLAILMKYLLNKQNISYERAMKYPEILMTNCNEREPSNPSEICIESAEH